MTFGEKRVRVEFNPSNDDLVTQIKLKTAELMNILIEAAEKYSGSDDEKLEIYYEKVRLGGIALDKFEEACMFAIKALTT